MEKLQALLTRKVAGVPVLAFVVLFGVALLYYALKMSPTPDPEVTTDANAPEGDGDPYTGDTSQPVFRATPTIMQPSGPGSVSAMPMQDTNELWGRRATEWLIGNGTSIDLSTRVISKYLDGAALTSDEVTIRDKAVRQFGLPPEAVPYAGIEPVTPSATSGGVDPAPTPDEPVTSIYDAPVQGGPPPVTAPPTPVPPPASAQGAPPLTHTVQSTRDNTYRDLALLYYGSTNVDLVQRIRAMESNADQPEPFSKGARIRVPKPNPEWFTATKLIKGANDIAAKNGITVRQLRLLNPAHNFPVPVGTRVQVG